MNHELDARAPVLNGSKERFDPVYRILQEAIAARAFPGCAFGVASGGEMVHCGALGRFTYEPESPAVAPDTVYDIASLTKVAATTAAAMLLVQQERLDPDSLLSDWLPAFITGRDPADPSRAIAIHHLFAHNSGLPGYVEFFRSSGTAAELLEACLKLPLEAPPGYRAEYSDPGYILLGKALEVCAGEDLASFTRREIFAPLGLASTYFCPALQTRPAIPPTEVDSNFRRRRIQGEVQDENAWLLGGVAGHAGLFSNVPDLLRFAGEILDGLRRSASNTARSSIFNAETISRFSERQAPQGSSRALGWDTPSENSSAGRYFPAHSIGHLGYSGCSIWIDLEARIAAVLLTNRTWPDRSNQAIRSVRPAFHNALRESL